MIRTRIQSFKQIAVCGFAYTTVALHMLGYFRKFFSDVLLSEGIESLQQSTPFVLTVSMCHKTSLTASHHFSGERTAYLPHCISGTGIYLTCSKTESLLDYQQLVFFRCVFVFCSREVLFSSFSVPLKHL